MEAKEIVAMELARQAEFGYEPSWEDFVIAGQVDGRREVVDCIKKIDRADKKLPILNVHGTDYTVLLCKGWRAKLKKWGMK